MKTCIYMRVSTQSQSLKRQESELMAVCRRNGWKDCTIIREKQSAYSKRERPGFQKLRGMVERGEVQNVVCHEISRLSRRLPDTVNFIHQCAEKGVNIYIHQLGLNTLGKDGKLHFAANIITSVLGSVAQAESESLSARIRSGNAQRRRNGGHVGRKLGAVCSREKILGRYSGKRGLFRAVKGGMSLRHCSRAYGISVPTVCRLRGLLAST